MYFFIFNIFNNYHNFYRKMIAYTLKLAQGNLLTWYLQIKCYFHFMSMPGRSVFQFFLCRLPRCCTQILRYDENSASHIDRIAVRLWVEMNILSTLYSIFSRNILSTLKDIVLFTKLYHWQWITETLYRIAWQNIHMYIVSIIDISLIPSISDDFLFK